MFLFIAKISNGLNKKSSMGHRCPTRYGKYYEISTNKDFYLSSISNSWKLQMWFLNKIFNKYLKVFSRYAFIDIRSTFSIACCREIPYSRRFRSVKAGACTSAASLMIPLLPATAGLSLPVPGVQLSSITIGRTMYCCLPSTCKKPESWRGDARKKTCRSCCYAAQRRINYIPRATLILSDIGRANKSGASAFASVLIEASCEKRYAERAFSGSFRPRSKPKHLDRESKRYEKCLAKRKQTRRADCTLQSLCARLH